MTGRRQELQDELEEAARAFVSAAAESELPQQAPSYARLTTAIGALDDYDLQRDRQRDQYAVLRFIARALTDRHPLARRIVDSPCPAMYCSRNAGWQANGTDVIGCKVHATKRLDALVTSRLIDAWMEIDGLTSRPTWYMSSAAYGKLSLDTALKMAAALGTGLPDDLRTVPK